MICDRCRRFEHVINIKIEPNNIKIVPNNIKIEPNNIKIVPNNIKIVPNDIKGHVITSDVLDAQASACLSFPQVITCL